MEKPWQEPRPENLILPRTTAKNKGKKMRLDMRTLKALLGLPENTEGEQAINAAIRRHWPGGAELLDVMTELHQITHRRPDARLMDLRNKLGEARNKIADAIRADGVFVAGPKPSETISLQSTAEMHPPTTPPECPKPEPVSIPQGAPDYYPLLGTMSDTQLGQQVGVSHTWIAKMRRKYGIPVYAAPKARIDWRRWDPILMGNTMTLAGLAARVGCDESTLRERRRMLVVNKGKYARPVGPPLAEDRIDWSNVNWSLQNATIARQKACSPQNVAAARKRYAPDTLPDSVE